MADNTLIGLTRAQYAGLDFDTHQDDIRAQIQAKFGAVYNDFAVASLGIMLIDIISYGLDTLSFYLDRRTTDTYLVTARTRKSISRLCRQLGYRMRGAVASSVSLQVTAPTSAIYPFTLPKGFQFQGPKETIFEAAQDVSFTAAGTKNVTCYEGDTLSETFFSDGTENQPFELRKVPDGKFVVEGTISVRVNGDAWVESEFITFDKTDQYEAGLNDDPPTVRFGDGVAGNIPTTGAEIVVEYVSCFGKVGQVGKETINAVVTDLIVANAAVDLVVLNAKGAVGGDDAEDLEHARIYAAKVWKTRLVAVTRGDYESLAGGYADPLYGAVATAQALAVRSAAGDLALQTLLNTVKALCTDVSVPIRASLAAADTALGLIVTSLSTQTTDLGDVATKSASIKTDQDSALSSLRISKNSAGEISTDCTDISNEVTAGKAEVDAITTHLTVSQLTAADKTVLKAYFDNIDAERSSISSNIGTITSYLGTVITLLGTVKDKCDEIGTTIGTGLVKDLDDERADIATQVGTSGVTPTGLYEDLEDIEDEVDKIDTTPSATATLTTTVAVEITDSYASQVTAAMESIYDHVDAMLAADCKVNLVSVPILTKDAGGFYTAPTVGLVQSLQEYLDARKEVTQTVSVVSGEDFLVLAVITVRLGVKRGFAESTTKLQAEAVVDSFLKDRAFGEKLYVAHVYDAIKAQVEGLAFHNVTITGPASKLDTDGNLIIDKSEVITKGTVTYTTEVVVED